MKADWQERVIAEKADLDEKLGKLENFLKSPQRLKLSIHDQCDLETQFFHMKQYAITLLRRIQRFPLDPSAVDEQEITA